MVRFKLNLERDLYFERVNAQKLNEGLRNADHRPVTHSVLYDLKIKHVKRVA